ncbi:MAG: uroporphyrinogen decarboxylase [Hyphomicrobiales bacterium]
MSSALLDVLSGRRPERRPVWLMRQAGRYLPEYREVRAKAGSFLNLCYAPDLAAEVTLQPLRRFDLDAAIVFADILVVPDAMGCRVEFKENEGPLLQEVTDMEAVRALGDGRGARQFEAVCETLRKVRQGLPPEKVLIGFCGAPWTVASYMVQGKGACRSKAVAVAEQGEAWFEALIGALVSVSTDYLLMQIEAGAQVLQIFDSWAGDLNAAGRERWVKAPIRAIIEGVRAKRPDVPVIVFGRGIGADHNDLCRAVGANAVSVEQGHDMLALLHQLPHHVAVQGNLAPELLVTGGREMAEAAQALCAALPKERHIFNLGHGILQTTPPEHVAELLSVIRVVDGAA